MQTWRRRHVKEVPKGIKAASNALKGEVKRKVLVQEQGNIQVKEPTGLSCVGSFIKVLTE